MRRPEEDLLVQVASEIGARAVVDLSQAAENVETADLLSCFDVLELVTDPEMFLSGIAQRARIGAFLVETCATHEPGTLAANRGWKTGRVLERHGWELVTVQGRARVWERTAETNRVRTSLMLVAFRGVSLATHHAITRLLTSDRTDARGWRERGAAEAGLIRARNIAASLWWAETDDDVFLMLDDDIIFEAQDAEHLVDLCRSGCDIVAGAYPVRSTAGLAIRSLDGREIRFGPGEPPCEMRFMSTGFFAVHRRVLDAMIPTLPLCHASTPEAFWPMFDFRVVEDAADGGWNHLSEDWLFCDRARALGFKVWLDPTIKLRHLSLVPISLSNMSDMAAAISHA